MRISGETIYQYIYVLPRGKLKATLIKGGYARNISIVISERIKLGNRQKLAEK
jgi:hypothetical protein